MPTLRTESPCHAEPHRFHERDDGQREQDRARASRVPGCGLGGNRETHAGHLPPCSRAARGAAMSPNLPIPILAGEVLRTQVNHQLVFWAKEMKRERFAQRTVVALPTG